MTLYPGLIVRINGRVIASVSSENLNIISVRIHGDVLSREVAILDVTGGYYGEPEETRHLLWVSEHEIFEQDEIEIQFQEIAANSHIGKTIEELYPKLSIPTDNKPQDITELAKYLQQQPRLRKGFDLYVSIGSTESHVFDVREPNYSFSISTMWDWKSMDSAKLWVSSSTIQSIVEEESGTNYLRGRINNSQSVRVRIGTQ